MLLPVQPKKIGILADFIFAHSTMIFFFSSGESIEVSPVEPMIRTAEVPLSSWNFSSVRNAAKSTEPSLLNGVMRATNEPVSSFLDILVSNGVISYMIARSLGQVSAAPRMMGLRCGNPGLGLRAFPLWRLAFNQR